MLDQGFHRMGPDLPSRPANRPSIGGMPDKTPDCAPALPGYSRASVPGDRRVTAFKQNETPPAWCELRHFAIVDLIDGQAVEQRRENPVERLIVIDGTVQAMLPGRSLVLKYNQFLDIANADRWTLIGRDPRSQLVRLAGNWGTDVGGCGLLVIDNDAHPVNTGDPVTHRKATSLDVHYHDCDEYWIVTEGRGTAWISGRFFPLGPGDCLAIGMGHHHDFPTVEQGPVRGAFFETTLQGQKRVGHLWAHTHGPAVAKPERV
jgi:mannose-6-phosphate isomerase-like protein (cupin superfamily)